MQSGLKEPSLKPPWSLVWKAT
uniref:Uncharacterized protein n=1 Tax=Anguilla anguilla TaxID=7936 RepID=A0A0E9VQD9_ANGAN